MSWEAATRLDEERVAAGQTPKYLITRRGGGHAQQAAYDLSSSELMQWDTPNTIPPETGT